ncbi:MAG: DUF2927 domain-containing protein [Clostridia bacterium]|nr:DUF2927 domain-containing protein [Clostridia bacterium]
MRNHKTAVKGIIMRLTAALLSLTVIAAAGGCVFSGGPDPSFSAAPETGSPGADVTAGNYDANATPPTSAESPSPEPQETPIELTEEEAEFWKKANGLIGYYEDVALRSEYGDADGKVHRWTEPVRFYAAPSADLDKYENYLRAVIDRLNAVEGFPGIVFADREEEADLTLEFVSAEKMGEITGSIGETALGYAVISWYNKTGRIFSGNIYIVCEEDSAEEDIRHTLLEETTQALGLMNDSNMYPDSIFYQGYSTVSELSEEDMILLRIHYSGYISEGMDANAVKEIAGRLANS